MRRDSIVFGVGLLAFVGVISLQAACGTGAKACAIVDVAAESCKIVRYLGPDGTVENLTADDLRDLAAAKKAARAKATGVTP